MNWALLRQIPVTGFTKLICLPLLRRVTDIPKFRVIIFDSYRLISTGGAANDRIRAWDQDIDRLTGGGRVVPGCNKQPVRSRCGWCRQSHPIISMRSPTGDPPAQVHQVENLILVLEDLSYIRENLDYSEWMNRRLHAWALARFQQRIEDKAREAGLPVTSDGSRRTSSCLRSCRSPDRTQRRG